MMIFDVLEILHEWIVEMRLSLPSAINALVLFSQDNDCNTGGNHFAMLKSIEAIRAPTLRLLALHSPLCACSRARWWWSLSTSTILYWTGEISDGDAFSSQREYKEWRKEDTNRHEGWRKREEACALQGGWCCHLWTPPHPCLQETPFQWLHTARNALKLRHDTHT